MTYAAGALLELPDGRIALHHRDNKPNIAAPDKWAFFGGMGEDGEDPIDTVIRELNEELDVTLTRDRLTHIHSEMHRPNHTRYIFHYPITNELEHAVLHEGQEWGTYTPEEIYQLNIVPAHLQIIEGYWHSKIRGSVYLAVCDKRVLLPRDGIDWQNTIDTPSKDIVIIPSAHSLMTQYSYTLQFTYTHHPRFTVEVYTICVTNTANSTVNLNEWVEISPETIQSDIADFHTRAIIKRYWKMHINN